MSSLTDISQFARLISEIKTDIQGILGVIAKMRNHYSEADLQTSAGISFLELKNHLMLGYLQNLVLLMMKKTSGLSIDNDLATARIVEIRTVLEKMRFLEKKIQYQIDKLMKASEADQKPGGDPLSFKPKLDQMLAPGGADEEQTLEESDDANSDEDTTKLTKSVKKGDIYVPPKLAAVPYNFDETPKDRLQKQNERAKKRALHSSIVQELRQEYYDEPEEVHDRDIYRMKTDKRAKEREEYEERNMIRLNVSKKDKAKSKRMTTMGNLSHLADFQDFRPMADDEDGEGNFGMSKTKKRKKAQKGKGKKGKKFKRKH